jgi:hypothetical protein
MATFWPAAANLMAVLSPPMPAPMMMFMVGEAGYSLLVIRYWLLGRVPQ